MNRQLQIKNPEIVGDYDVGVKQKVGVAKVQMKNVLTKIATGSYSWFIYLKLFYGLFRFESVGEIIVLFLRH